MHADDLQQRFLDPQAVDAYVEGVRRFVPGLADLHTMTGLLLAERAPSNARILVLGAGGGLELRAMADAHPGWTFVGVDPAEPMLRLAERTLAGLSDRVELVRGYLDDAPAGPFDGATCLLTLHFLEPHERRRTLHALHSRLKPGSPLVVAHSSFSQDAGSRSRWLRRYAAFAVASGVEPDQAEEVRAAVDASLHVLSPDHDEALMREAGFADVEGFFVAFSWRGWVATA